MKERMGGGIKYDFCTIWDLLVCFSLLQFIWPSKNRLKEDIILLALFNFLLLLLFSQIPLMHSMVGLIIATALYSGNKKMV